MAHTKKNKLLRKLKKKARAKRKPAGETYWDHIVNEHSLMSWALDEPSDSLMSIETTDVANGVLDIRSFTQNDPEKIIALLSNLRPEFRELFLEYYLLEKSQSFLGRAHGCVQTRIWQTLRIVEQAVGAILILGSSPCAEVLRPILEKNGLEDTGVGSLSEMIALYAQSQSYSAVAKSIKKPVPTVRKIFRPAIDTLLSAKDIRSVAAGCYLRNLTHQASLTGVGISQRAINRLRRVKLQNFKAPATIESSCFFEFNRCSTLADTPWIMLEISSDQRINQILPVMAKAGKKVFGKTPAQVFAPVGDDGELSMGYIFARSADPGLTYNLRRIRGITEMSAVHDETDRIVKVITVPHADLAPMVEKERQKTVTVPDVQVGDFVEITTGDAARYCGTVIDKKGIKISVSVRFPSGRAFSVTADPTAVRIIPNVPADKRNFWGA